jgi:hypothetical protein
LLVLILTVLGVAYTSLSRQPIVVYWGLLAPIIGVVCVGAGWRNATDKPAKWQLVWTQALHWLAFVIVMNLLLLPDVQRVFSGTATAVAITTLLALGTFTAGVHVLSWQICLLGLIMALGIPAIAWIERSFLILMVVAAGALGIAALLWWRRHDKGGRPGPAA